MKAAQSVCSKARPPGRKPEGDFRRGGGWGQTGIGQGGGGVENGQYGGRTGRRRWDRALRALRRVRCRTSRTLGTVQTCAKGPTIITPQPGLYFVTTAGGRGNVGPTHALFDPTDSQSYMADGWWNPPPLLGPNGAVAKRRGGMEAGTPTQARRGLSAGLLLTGGGGSSPPAPPPPPPAVVLRF